MLVSVVWCVLCVHKQDQGQHLFVFVPFLRSSSDVLPTTCARPARHDVHGATFTAAVMCFSAEMSGAFSVIGFLVCIWVFRSSGNTTVATGIFYFVLMEALQFVQYMYIARDVDPLAPTLASLQASPKCQAAENQFLTFLGFLHICFQPYFTHFMSCGFATSPAAKAQFGLVRRLCLLGGAWLCSRSLLALYPDFFERLGLEHLFGDAEYLSHGGEQGHVPREWLSGGVLCTYQGTRHLAWSVPMIAPSYYVPAGSIHMFLMFVPFFLVEHGSWLLNCFNWMCGLSIFLIGPVLGDAITSNKHEAASIWCFFSIVQCSSFVVMTFCKSFMPVGVTLVHRQSVVYEQDQAR